MRHDFETGVTDSVYLFRDYLETDNPGHLRTPERDGDLIIFATYGSSFSLRADLTVVRDSTSVN